VSRRGPRVTQTLEIAAPNGAPRPPPLRPQAAKALPGTVEGAKPNSEIVRRPPGVLQDPT